MPAAQKGFFVDCIEKSEGGVQILNRRLESQNAKNYVNVECGDMLDFGFDLSVYDAVILLMQYIILQLFQLEIMLSKYRIVQKIMVRIL